MRGGSAGGTRMRTPLPPREAGGRLILQLGSTVFSQVLTLVTRTGETFSVMQMGPVAFVLMTGEVQKRR